MQTWKHDETSLSAVDSEMPFNNGIESAMDLDPEHFATVIIEDQMKNDRLHNIGYALQPFSPGTARHYDAGERWTLHDIYVTRGVPAENAFALGHGAASRPDITPSAVRTGNSATDIPARRRGGCPICQDGSSVRCSASLTRFASSTSIDVATICAIFRAL